MDLQRAYTSATFASYLKNESFQLSVFEKRKKIVIRRMVDISWTEVLKAEKIELLD